MIGKRKSQLPGGQGQGGFRTEEMSITEECLRGHGREKDLSVARRTAPESGKDKCQISCPINVLMHIFKGEETNQCLKTGYRVVRYLSGIIHLIT